MFGYLIMVKLIKNNNFFFLTFLFFFVAVLRWRQLETTGDIPSKRSQHAAQSLIEENRMIVFGGWNGTEYLDDLYNFDIVSLEWKKLDIKGEIPSPRAGNFLIVAI